LAPELALTEYVKLISGSGNGYITVSTCLDEHFNSLRSQHVVAKDTDAVVRLLESTPKNGQAFLNIGRMHTPPAQGRGKLTDMSYLSVIGMDIDVADPAKPEKNLPATIDEALSVLESFPTPPTLVVQSGRGLHAYFKLLEELVFTTDVERKAAAQIVEGLYRGFAQHAEPFEFDSTKDITRMFRAPGSHNLKDPANPIPVTVLFHDLDRQYSLEDIAQVSVEKQVRVWDATASDELTDNGTLLDFAKIKKGCPWVQKAVANARTATYDEWFAMASITALCNNGRQLFHEYSQQHRDYDADECDAKFDQVDQHANTMNNILCFFCLFVCLFV
jgi:hypothetical protein